MRTSDHLRYVESMATVPSDTVAITRLNAVILGVALASEEDDLFFPSHHVSQHALVPSPQKQKWNLLWLLIPSVLKLLVGVEHEIGAFAVPYKIRWAPGLPMTRIGKVMRMILRKIASRQLDELGDTSTLAVPNVVDQLISLIVVKFLV
ncbi:hypothetical protein LguiA_014423 [Lonicera macranthoides]